MVLELDVCQVRVLGALMEKELATPDQYPLSMAGLVAACNQKTSRDPLMQLADGEVDEALRFLIGESLVRERRPAGARVSKYSHRLSDSLGLSFGFDRPQLAVLAVLMLRGAQTPGELKSRSERMRGDAGDVDMVAVLESLETHERGAWVRELPREPGKRESRWTHLMGGSLDSRDPPRPEITSAVSASDTLEGSAPTAAAVPAPPEAAPRATLAADAGLLEARVSELETTVAELQARLRALEQEWHG